MTGQTRWTWLLMAVLYFVVPPHGAAVCQKYCKLESEYCFTLANGECNTDKCYQWRILMGDFEVPNPSCWQCGKHNGGEGEDGYCDDGAMNLVCKKGTGTILWRERGGCSQKCAPRNGNTWVPASGFISGPANGTSSQYICVEKPGSNP